MIREIDDDRLYEFACKVVNEFEQVAMESGSRAGILAVINGPLDSMDFMLEQSQRVVGSVKTARSSLGGYQRNPRTTPHLDPPRERPETEFGGGGERPPGGGAIRPDEDSEDLEEQAAFQIDLDADINEVLNSTGISLGGRELGDYLAECLGCDLRLQFDWQLKPVNLLAPIEAMLDQFERLLASIEASVNPYRALSGICDLLNALKTICIPDLILILASLKLLFRKYLTSAVNVKLDWTAVLGPILKAVIQGVSSLLDNISAVLIAPLDCALGSLKVANELEREIRDLSYHVSVFAKETKEDVQSILSGEIPANYEFNGITKDVGWTGPDLGSEEDNRAPRSFGQLSLVSRPEFGPNNDPTKVAVPVGFEFDASTTVAGALRDPSFVDATMIQKLIIPVQEVRRYIQDLVAAVNKSFRSLEGLVGGGLTLQLDGLLGMLFITDIIAFVIMMIRMIAGNRTVEDWCQYLEENPSLLEEGLRGRFGSDLRVGTTAYWRD
jgi:hypothetical protein